MVKMEPQVLLKPTALSYPPLLLLHLHPSYLPQLSLSFTFLLRHRAWVSLTQERPASVDTKPLPQAGRLGRKERGVSPAQSCWEGDSEEREFGCQMDLGLSRALFLTD